MRRAEELWAYSFIYATEATQKHVSQVSSKSESQKWWKLLMPKDDVNEASKPNQNQGAKVSY